MDDELTVDEREQPVERRLEGGNTTQVVQVSDTVRRETGPWTPTVHALLQHLERAGFTAAPRALGIDEQGREVLSYVEGSCGSYPLPPAWTGDSSVIAAARLLRAFHDAQAGFVPPPGAVWRAFGPPPPDADVICHHDAAPYNTVLRPDGSFALIDFDMASPGRRLYDVAFSAWVWTPLYSDADSVEHGWTAPDRPRRLRLFADSYGLVPADRTALLGVIRARMVDHVEGMRRLAEAGEPAFVALWQQGHGERVHRDLAMLDEQAPVLQQALR